MQTCEEHGDSVVVYVEITCPVCVQIADLERENTGLEKEIENLNEQIEELNKE